MIVSIIFWNAGQGSMTKIAKDTPPHMTQSGSLDQTLILHVRCQYVCQQQDKHAQSRLTTPGIKWIYRDYRTHDDRFCLSS